MRGMAFTQFLEMVEEKFSATMVENIIDLSDLPSGGAYTALGNYADSEMTQLVWHLSQQTGVAVPVLLRFFGEYLFARFPALYPQYFEGVSDPFDLLERMDDYFQVEEKKLYPDSDLASMRCERPGRDVLTMYYRSVRPLADLIEGMIRGCIDHFGARVEIQRDDEPGAAGTAATFTLTRQA
jgi:hypothetical protein